MKKNLSIFILIFTSIFCLQAQQNYWQQEVNYEIKCTLDDKTHTLDAFIEMEYINNSPDELREIYFHLWPNAYSSLKTAFTEQKLESGSTKFYYQPNSKRGGVDGFDWKVDGKSANFSLVSDTLPDVGLLTLNKPLKSGEKINISTPFTLKIPESVSRLGHVDESYQITQWYPKPAVYDQNGWHEMPYLDLGEFYSEFGSFDVKITLPDNYVVGATGELQTASEVEFLNNLAKKTAQIDAFDTNTDFPESSTNFKTLHYKQDQVHDFAWFADKRFHVLKDTAYLESGKMVECWAMFTNQENEIWKRGAEYIKKGVEHYSKHVGEYPYAHCTAVQSALSAGAGMEYPMITVIGVSGTPRALETVIVHEVGHNWFYGILGSNERDNPWMDEGFNSYYEHRYFTENYDNNNLTAMMGLPDFATKTFGLDDFSERDFYEMLINTQNRRNTDQPVSSCSRCCSDFNYGMMIYKKTALALDYLEESLGNVVFDQIIKEYYDTWKFKHPQPENVRQLFEERTGRYLDWFFDDMINSTKDTDYKVQKVVKNKEKIGNSTYDEVTLSNKNKNAYGPFTLSSVKDGKIRETIWYDGFHGEMPVLFPSADYDKIVLDAHHYNIESNRNNNHYKVKGLFKKVEPLQIKFLGDMEREDRTQLFWSPLIGFNKYDGTMLGLSFYNNILPNKPFEFTVSPLFGFKSNKLGGFVNTTYTFLPQNGIFQNIKLNFEGTAFSFGYAELIPSRMPTIDEQAIQYFKMAPSITFNLKKPSVRSKKSQSLNLRFVQILTTDITLTEPQDSEGNFEVDPPLNYYNDDHIFEVSYNFKNGRAINPYGAELVVQQGDKMTFGSADFDYQIRFNRKKKMDIRLYGGYFFNNKTIDADDAPTKQIDFSGRGTYDYLYDDLYLDRNPETPFFRNQITDRTGGFRTSTAVGANDEWIASMNITSDLPLLNLPIDLFADFGVFPDSNQFAEKPIDFVYGVGLAVNLGKNIGIYVPIFYSERIKDGFKAGNINFWERITFKVNFRDLDPIKFVRGVEF